MIWDQEIFNKNLEMLIKGKFGDARGSQARFNQKFGRDAATRWKKERPSLDNILAISEYFNCSIDWLLTENDAAPSCVGTTIAFEKEDPKTKHLLNLAREVLESETHYSASLESNIKSFKQGLDSEKPKGNPTKGKGKGKGLGRPKLNSGGG